MDRRLLILAKKAFRIAPSLREAVFLDRIQATMGCSGALAKTHLEDLVLGGYALIRGYGTARLVYPGPNIDSLMLRSVGVDIPRG
jgi:hypothetical protein